MRRKVYDQLKKWKEEQNGESAVLINGARRVGKSYIVKEFAQEEYKSYILLDFNKIGKNIKSLFETYLDDLDTFFMYLSSFTNTANSTSKCKITKCFCKSTPLVLRNSISFLVSH